MDANSKDAVATFSDRGYVRLTGLFSPSEVAEIHSRIERAAHRALTVMKEGDYVLEADGTSIRNMWRLQDYDPFFAGLGNRPHVMAIVRELLGDEPVLLAVETFNKPARQGSAVPAHQDNAYFCLKPPDALTLWVAIDPVTQANGPVSYLGGTQHELRAHKASGIPGNSMILVETPAESEAAEAEQGLLAPGDAIAHHSQTIHWSAPNGSDASRCGMLLVYRASDARTDTALKDAYREALAALAAGQPAPQLS